LPANRADKVGTHTINAPGAVAENAEADDNNPQEFLRHFFSESRKMHFI